MISGWTRLSLAMTFPKRRSSRMMIPKTIVVAPTTAVPMRTGLAVALKVLPAPSADSRIVLGLLEIRFDAEVLLDHFLGILAAFDHGEFIDGLGVVRDRTEAVHGDRDRTHAEETEGDETEGEDRGGKQKSFGIRPMTEPLWETR